MNAPFNHKKTETGDFVLLYIGFKHLKNDNNMKFINISHYYTSIADMLESYIKNKF